MKVRRYDKPASFLEEVGQVLEEQEAANSLMLGVCSHLARHPERNQSPVCLRAVFESGVLYLTAMMTPPHPLVVYAREENMTANRRLVQDLLRGGWKVPGVRGPRPASIGFAAQWAIGNGLDIQTWERQRLYELRQVATPTPEHGSLRQATEGEVGLVTDWLMGYYQELFGHADREAVTREVAIRVGDGAFYLWEDGGPVSMAQKTRPTRRGISISSVYTPPAWRRRGYATACVAELSRLLLGEGRAFCTLFAEVENRAAMRVYERIGFRPVVDHEEYRFVAQPSGPRPGGPGRRVLPARRS